MSARELLIQHATRSFAKKLSQSSDTARRLGIKRSGRVSDFKKRLMTAVCRTRDIPPPWDAFAAGNETGTNRDELVAASFADSSFHRSI